MPSSSNIKSSYDPDRQLELVTLKCIALGPDIYKSLAFYLQLIRLTLPTAIKDAVYQLIILNKNTLGPLNLDSNKNHNVLTIQVLL